LDRAGQFNRSRELTHLAVQLAREAVESSGQAVFIAGSMSPVEDCYSPHLVPPDAELRVEHQEMARDLAEAGCDMLLIETMNTIREAVIATEAAISTGRPVCVSFVVGPNGRPPEDPAAALGHEALLLLSGEAIEDAVHTVGRLRPNAILINCVPFNVIDRAFDQLCLACNPPNRTVPGSRSNVGLYANIGHADAKVGWVLTDEVRPEAYARRASEWIRRGAKIVGGCCGTTPAHIAAVKNIM
ncbi:MAG TPA: homocysteine S-methyltransferase family protein, partial [Anaerolineae bacterium]|nr:homocysteine S-methyltransferase family protein [Anaerolineae bacterium]